MLGTALAVGSALSYSFTIIANRSLAKAGIRAPTALGVRFGIAALVLFAGLAVSRQPLLPVTGERVRVALLGAIGYAVESTFFYMGLERGTAAAVALLFYAYPAMVTVLEVGLGTARASRRTFAALALSAGGTVLLIVAGSRVTISPTGITFALAAAASFAIYLLVSDRLVTRSPALPIAALVALGAAVSFALRAVVTGAVQSPAGHWLPLIGNGLATASAFAMMFAALRQLGATRTAVVMTLEAVFAVVLGATVLGEPLKPLQAVGGLAVIAATVIVASRRHAVYDLPTGR